MANVVVNMTDVLRLWSYEDRRRKISCLYGTTINSANIRYTAVYEQSLDARSTINYTSDINIDMVDGIIYCDIRTCIFKCLPVFLRDCTLEISPYKLYCKMVALYNVDWEFSLMTRIVKCIREYKNYKLFKIIVKRDVIV
jgi:hypothetical protein